MNILIAITAKNEELTIRDTILSIRSAISTAEKIIDISYDLTVVLNDSTDNTFHNIPSGTSIIKTTGGLVEAQRAVANKTPFVIFADADIIVSPSALIEVTKAMLDNPNLAITYPEKIPLKPKSNSCLANALYTYNKNNGFENTRQHFNGKFFAIRNWDIPKKNTLQNMNGDPLWSLQDGVIADDIYLSKFILSSRGSDAIKQTGGIIYFQAPESFNGMYCYYRRMKIELKRIALLFPEMHWPKEAQRITDFTKIKSATIREQFDWLVFQLAFQLCKLRFWWEKKCALRSNNKLASIWQTIEETKTTFNTDLTKLNLKHCEPLEIWDLEIEGKTLWEWQEHDDYAQKLRQGIEAIRNGTAHTRSKGKVKQVAENFEGIFITGGRSNHKQLRNIFPDAHFSKNSIFAACEAALNNWPEALVIDVGQTQIKVAYKDKRETYTRNYELLPIGKASTKGNLLTFIQESLPAIQPEHVILALPCYVHDDLKLEGSSYVEMKQNPNLLHDLSLRYPTAKWQIINDAELASLCVKYTNKKTLVLTLGFGTGACIIDPS